MASRRRTLNDERRLSDDPPPELLVLRPLPKVIFLYPLFLVSLVLALLAYQWPAHLDEYASAFIVVAFLNFSVLAFDLPKTGMLTIYALAVAAVLALVLVRMKWADALPDAMEWALGLEATANTRFYVAFALALGLLLIVVLLVRFKADYVMITPMEVRHSVLLGNSVAYPMEQIANYGTEEPDVLEHMLLRCGRIWIQPIGGRTIVVEHVPHIRQRNRQLSHLFSHLDVRVVRQ